jgi:oligopeptide/dipeptide ABC transporter ATP-binding protein
MRQRAMIAMALSCQPALLIADEPTTALDVTIQAQVLELMQELKRELGMAMLFITHNLGVISEIADDTAIMYLGQIVEQAETDVVFSRPLHPYAQALLAAIPRLNQLPRTPLASIEGNVPPPINLPPGCRFFGRCRLGVQGVCDQHQPALLEVEVGHKVRCHVYSRPEDFRHVDIESRPRS